METLNTIGLIGILVSVAIYIPFLIFLALCVWSALIEKVRAVFGVELAVIDYLRNRAEFKKWKRSRDAERGE